MKQTGQIKLSKDSLIPNQRGLWFSCFEKLEESRLGIQQMINANDRVTYESGWVRFVESIEESWTSFFEEGQKSFSNFQPWAGITIKHRKSGLLKYLTESRHQSQHGNIKLDWENGHIQIAPNYYGHIKDLKIFADNSFEVDATPLGEVHNKVTLVHSTGDAKLPTIVNKLRNTKFTPPTEHLGEKINTTLPHQIAKIAINYYQGIYQNAVDKFCKK